MKIVVTGSSGRIGSAVVGDLLAQGHEPVCVDVRPAQGPEGSETPPTHVLDLRKPAELVKAFKNADAICHLGNWPGITQDRLTEGFDNNVVSTHSVFEAAMRAGVGKVVYASSIQAYGVLAHPDTPKLVSAPRYLPLDEDHPLLPCDAYPLTKAMGEHIAEAFVRRQPGLQVFSLRFGAVTLRDWRAPADQVMPAIGRASTLLGNSLLTFAHINDVARAVRLCCQTERRGHTALNITAPRLARPWARQEMLQLWGIVPEFRTPMTENSPLVAVDRARQVLGFVAEWPFVAGASAALKMNVPEACGGCARKLGA